MLEALAAETTGTVVEAGNGTEGGLIGDEVAATVAAGAPTGAGGFITAIGVVEA